MSKAVGNYGGVAYPITAGAFAVSSNADSGSLLFKAFPWGLYKSAQFHVVGTSGSLSIVCYGTMDVNTAASTAVPASPANWFQFVAPSSEASPTWANPIVAGSNSLLYVQALFNAVRFLITGSGNGTLFVGVAP